MDEDIELLLALFEYTIDRLKYLKQRVYFRRYYKRKKDNLVVRRRMKRAPKCVKYDFRHIVVDFK